MPFPAPVLFLGLGALALASSSTKKSKPKPPSDAGARLQIATASLANRGPSLQTMAKVADAIPPASRAQILAAYGQGAVDDYPAPYDWESTESVCFWLTSRMHYQKARWPYVERVRTRFTRIRGSAMSRRDKALAAIWEVAIPAFGYSLLWRWAVDTPSDSDLERGVRQKQLAAVLTWLGFWALGPETSTVVREGAGYTPVVSAELQQRPYRIHGEAIPAPNAAARRDVLLAMHQTIRDLGCFTYGGAYNCETIRIPAAQRVAKIQAQYAGIDRFDAGNVLLLKELVALGVTANTTFFRINLPSKSEMVLQLVVNIAAIALVALAPVAAGAIAAAISAVSATVEATAAAIIGQAAATGIGSYVSMGIQAAIGAAVAWVLKESDILSGITEGTEIGKMVAKAIDEEDADQAAKAAQKVADQLPV